MPQPRHSAKFFLFFLKSTLPSAPAQALGKVFLNNFFAECLYLGIRQRISDFKKKYFAECRGEALGKEILYFFYAKNPDKHIYDGLIHILWVS